MLLPSLLTLLLPALPFASATTHDRRSFPHVARDASLVVAAAAANASSESSSSSSLAFSPPVYPSPNTTATGSWVSAVTKAKALIKNWTVEQKLNVTFGFYENYRCTGNVAAQPSLGFPGICLQDGPLGVRSADRTSAFPAGQNIAATWDTALMRKRGVALGEEFRGKGVNVALGPGVNLMRVPVAGRNFEMFGADPYLTGENAYFYIDGLQSTGVAACIKHLIGYEMETDRLLESSNIDDRTLHELYLHPFLRGIQANVAIVMSSYNQINNSYASQNSKVLNGLLKTELGFLGPVISDWSGQSSGVAAALAGLDMEMPGSKFFGQLSAAVKNGSFPAWRATDMATRIIAAGFLLGQDSGYPAVNFDVNSFNVASPLNLRVDVQANHSDLIREIGAASTVLLKNTNSVLPLKNLVTVAVFGSDAGPSPLGANRQPFSYDDETGDLGVLASGAGSGTHEYPYLIDPLSAIQARSKKDHTSVSWILDPYAYDGIIATATGADAAIVFINEDAGEGLDRYNLTSWRGGEQLVATVAAVNPNTIVVIHASGLMTIEDWISNPNVTAVLFAGLPGQEAGNSIVDVLYGDVNPSARLPFTIAKQRSDYPADAPTSIDPAILQVDYSEKLNIDYRYFLANNIEPRFAFGYGLSYTTFTYSSIAITSASAYKASDAAAVQSVVGSSVVAWLHADRWTVKFVVTNSGKVAGSEVSQLYLTYPTSAGEPPKVLRGFAKTALTAGAKSTVTITLSTYDLSIWNVVKQAWTLPTGKFTVTIGQNVLDSKLTATITV